MSNKCEHQNYSRVLASYGVILLLMCFLSAMISELSTVVCTDTYTLKAYNASAIPSDCKCPWAKVQLTIRRSFKSFAPFLIKKQISEQKLLLLIGIGKYIERIKFSIFQVQYNFEEKPTQTDVGCPPDVATAERTAIAKKVITYLHLTVVWYVFACSGRPRATMRWIWENGRRYKEI